MQNGKSTRLTILIVLILVFCAGTGFAQRATARGVDPENLRVRYGFGQFYTGYSVQFAPLMHMITFGGRGGSFLGRSDKLYMGGGGVGGFSLGPTAGGGGYGTLQVGFRNAFGRSSMGYDLAAGVGFGGYGTALESGFYLGPTASLGIFFGARGNNEIGIFAQTLVNVLDLGRTVINVGIMFGGKTGTVYTDWADRRRLN